MTSPRPTHIVGVGASAGGLEAFKRLLAALPADTGMTFVLVQHLDPTHDSLLVGLLEPYTEMEVREAADGVRLAPDTVYVIRPGTALGVRDGRLVETPPELHHGVRLPVDHLFRSLARECGPRAVAVVLSGAGSDGSVGIRAIKGAGGLAVAQVPGSGDQPGMPQHAIDTGIVDLVLEIAEIPEALQRFAELPPQDPTGPPDADDDGEGRRVPNLSAAQFELLCSALTREVDLDLRVYKPATIGRRIARRMTLSGITDVGDYVERVRTEAPERLALARDFLISVTEFFRDARAFEALRETVVEPLVAAAEPAATLRVWTPGCATGEEAYSIGMEFLDAIAAADGRLSLQIFATDLDGDALGFARTAVYPPSIADQVSQDRLERYFEPLDGRGYRVRSRLRDVVSFAVHDLTKDPPFSRMHLVTCRNVLIYLTSDTQQDVLGVLHFALEPDGHLFLGTSESVGAQRDLFDSVSKPYHIFRKTGRSRPVRAGRARAGVGGQMAGAGATDKRPRPRRRPTEGDVARRAILEAMVPPTVVVSGEGQVLFSHGELGPYLRIPQGDHPRLELDAMLRPDIRTRTKGAMFNCRRDREPVVALSSPDGPSGQIRITARPAPAIGAEAVILTFERAREAAEPAQTAPAADSPGLVEQLELELQATREDLRSTVDELEASNEDLRSAHEEAMSMNEELQSANEELEATTEELRSLNEELTTVNAQLRDKIEQVEQAHNDLTNFFASTNVATIFLDEQLRLKRFTPAARELLSIDHADSGRAITDLARDLLGDDLTAEAGGVLERLVSSTREIRTGSGRWFTRVVLPYRTEQRRIQGVVVTFIDVTELKQATELLAQREGQQATIAQFGMLALREGNLQGFMDQAVRDIQQALGTDYCKILELQPGRQRLLLRSGVGWQPGLVGSVFVGTGADSQAGYTLQASGPVIVDDLSREKRFSGPSLLVEHGVVSGLSCTIRDGESDYGVLGAHTREPRKFSQEDADFLGAVATVIGSAIGRHQTRLRLAVELAVASTLADAEDPDEALASVVDRIREETGAAVGELWWPDEEGERLSCRAIRVEAGMDRKIVAEQFSHRTFTPGEGIVGRVFTDGRAAWCTNLGDPALFVRRDAADRLGLVAAFAIPILAGPRVLGVVTVFSKERLIADPAFLQSFDGIGRAVGEYVVRTEIERHVGRLATITESSHDAIFTYDHAGIVTEWLVGSERLFGFTAEEMVGENVSRIVPEDRRDESWEIHERIRQGEVVEPYETVRNCKNGTTVDVSVRNSPVKDRQGRIVGVSATVRDIRRQKDAERRLLEADRMKDEFLAMLGHELRNPLAAICSSSELLKATAGDDPRLAKVQRVIDRQSRHMAKLLDGLLEVSRVIRGKIDLNTATVDLAEIVGEVIDDVRNRATSSLPKFRSDIAAGPVWVDGDRMRLIQIVDNLLSNAVKYTREDGQITVSLKTADELAVLRVRDTGTGIEPDFLPHVFEMFRQSQQNIDRSNGGLGLGLALVQSLTRLHGGSVEAHSAGRDLGAEFVVKLPVAQRAAAARPAEASVEDSRPPADGYEILLIEDNEDAAEMLQQVLELAGHRVTVATHGARGITQASEEPPDVIFCDLGLPGGVSGFDVARYIRADPRLKEVPLVAVSGYGQPDDIERGREAGFDAHLTKPVDSEGLQQVLTMVVPRAGAG